MAIQTRVGRTLLKSMNEWKYKHKTGNGKSCEERERERLQTELVPWEMEIHVWGRARHDMTPSMAGTGQGGMAQREEREKTFRKLAGKQNGKIQGSRVEEVYPTNSSEECSAPAHSITLRSWST